MHDNKGKSELEKIRPYICNNKQSYL